MQRPSRRWSWLVVPLLGPLFAAWPLPLAWRSALLAAPDQEAATHVWGLWAALHTGRAPLVQTDLLGFPEGVELVLVDAANLPLFALGHALGGAVGGYNTVLYGGLALMGLAGGLLARQVGGSAWLGAVVGLTCPAVLANAADGMTEGFAVGWAGVSLALLLAWYDRGRAWRAVLAALTLALAWYSGPYNGVWACLLAVGATLGLLVREAGRRRLVALRCLAVALPSALLVAPLASLILGHRPEHLPGAAERAGLPPPVDNPAIFRGGIQTGADLLDPFLPGPLTGGEAEVSHTAYLGVVVLLAAIVAVIRDRRLWPWLAGALGMVALALGPYLFIGGEAQHAGESPLLAPAGMLVLAVPAFFGRITRWYRAAAVATLLLAPLVARQGRRPVIGAAIGVLVALDVALLAPLAWPLHASAPPEVAPYDVLDGEGALLEIPPATTGQPPPGRWRDRTGIAQVAHGHPVQGGVMRLGGGATGRRAQALVEGLMRTGLLPAEDGAGLDETGFRWLAIYPEYRPMPADARALLEGCLGEPLAATDEVWIYSFDAARHGCGNTGAAEESDPQAPE